MDKITLPIVRTVFLPKGSPGICTIKQITTDIRDPMISAADGQIYVSGEVDIVIDYLSYATDETAGRSSGFKDLDEYMPGSGRLWQALLTLPFETTTTGLLNCSSNCELATGEIKWFLVSPHAIEMTMDLQLKELTYIDDELTQGMRDYQQGLRDLQQGLDDLQAGEAARQAGEAARQAGETARQSATGAKVKTVFERKTEMSEIPEKQKTKANENVQMTKMPEANKQKMESAEIKKMESSENMENPQMSGATKQKMEAAETKKMESSENMENPQMSGANKQNMESAEMKKMESSENMENPQMSGANKQQMESNENISNTQMSGATKQGTKSQMQSSQMSQTTMQRQTTPNQSNISGAKSSASKCYKMRFYRVMPNDNWNDIALKTGCSVETLIAANGSEGQQLTPGKVLIIK